MKVKVIVSRTKDFLEELAFQTGDNVDRTVAVEVCPAELSDASRRALLLAGGGKYPDSIEGFLFDSQGDIEVARYSSYGQELITFDSPEYTLRDVDDAIQAAYTKVLTRGNEIRRIAREKIEKDAAMKKARELLASEITAMEVRIAELSQRVNEQVNNNKELALFVSRIAYDAKMKVVEEMAEEKHGNERIMQRLEDIAHTHTIFKKD